MLSERSGGKSGTFISSKRWKSIDQIKYFQSKRNGYEKVNADSDIPRPEPEKVENEFVTKCAIYCKLAAEYVSSNLIVVEDCKFNIDGT